MRYTVYYWMQGKGGMNGQHFDKLSSAKSFAKKKHEDGYSVSIYDAWKMKTGTLKFLK